MNYHSIQIYGNILSPDLLNRLDSDDTVAGQRPKDFGLDANQKVRDEISQAWSFANSYYKNYRNRIEKLKYGQSGESETRNFWIYPLLGLLGYTLRYEKTAQTLNDKTYHITDPTENLDDFPVIISGFEQNMDKKPTGLRMSPHTLMQEYLNHNEAHLFGLVTNGRTIRLLRDSGRIIRLSYVEIDLQRMFEEGLYADFAALYRMLHATRMPQKQHSGPECLMERYHLDALESGTRIREKLSEAVEEAILTFGKGFLAHPANSALREALESGQLNANTYYRYLLRLIYRLLFLMVIEERNLVYPDVREEAVRRLRDIYYRFYSVGRLRNLTRNPWLKDARYTDLWKGLQHAFRLFEKNTYGGPLNIIPLNGELFNASALGLLEDAELDNKTLLTALEHLSWFTAPNGNIQPINYKLLNVEEFGSVYEGLLEYDPEVQQIGAKWTFGFKRGSGRSSSGSHYTPEELVQPLIKHSLDYILEDREALIKKEIDQQKLHGDAKHELRESIVAKHLLSLNIADVACGSGHILLSAARRIADRYAAWTEESDQPTPSGQRHAIRLVIRNCIYGVDKNPLAVELCKVALWLEAHNPGEPLSFLDHHIKCGDAIVGLAHREELENGIATEAFKTLPGDDKEIAQALAKKNKQERTLAEAKVTQTRAQFDKTIATGVQEAMEEYRTFSRMPEVTPDDIAAKAHAYKRFLDGKGYGFLKTMADTQVAQFFIPKTEANKDKLITDADYRQILSGYQGWTGPKTATASAIASQKRFFHWFLEFPEVFSEGGFDCILGNPPYLGGSKISSNFEDYYLEFLHFSYPYAKGLADLATFFLRRNAQITNSNAFLSLITTNTISQGDTREGGLGFLLKNKLRILFAIKSMAWPGKAAVDISLISLTHSNKSFNIFLGNKQVSSISSHLDDNPEILPFQLLTRRNLSVMGAKVYGQGFILDDNGKNLLIEKEPNSIEVIYPYLIGDEINTDPNQRPDRFVINFKNWALNEVQDNLSEKPKGPPYASNYIQCLQRVELLVKPEREKNKRENRKEKWWQFGEIAPRLFDLLSEKNLALFSSRVTKYVQFSLLDSKVVPSEAVVIIKFTNWIDFTITNNSFHDFWSWRFSSTMGGTTVRYSNSEAFETFPIPQNLNSESEQKLEKIGECYHVHRRQLMLSMQLGLTKTYNAFHANEIQEDVNAQTLEKLDKKAIEKLGKEVWNLWNQLQRTEGTCSFDEAVAGILKLRQLHVEMDNAVLEAYGWQDVQLRHDFYEVDYLPENDRIRYTIHPDARKEILKRLLKLYHKIHEEEVKAGLWDKKKPTKETKPNKTKAPDPNAGLFGYGGLFDKN